MNKKNGDIIIKSGNPLVDAKWGGFYKGGTYFIKGPSKSGKTISSLQFAFDSVNKNNTCLFLTTS